MRYPILFCGIIEPTINKQDCTTMSYCLANNLCRWYPIWRRIERKETIIELSRKIDYWVKYEIYRVSYVFRYDSLFSTRISCSKVSRKS